MWGLHGIVFKARQLRLQPYETSMVPGAMLPRQQISLQGIDIATGQMTTEHHSLAPAIPGLDDAARLAATSLPPMVAQALARGSWAYNL